MLKKSLHHHYPKILLWQPKLIWVLYSLNSLVQLRKWYVNAAIKKTIAKQKSNFVYADFGCGEMQYLFPQAHAHKQSTFIGIDKSLSNIQFGELYIKKAKLINCNFYEADIDNFTLTTKAHIAICISMLQYVNNDSIVLKNIYNSLQSNGTLLLYMPINNQLATKFYKYLFNKYESYETIQNRKKIYTDTELLQKIENAGFTIKQTTYTYGWFGRLSHEIYTSLILCIVNFNLLVKIVCGLMLVIFCPIILLLMAIDFFTRNKTGNGILIEANASC